MNFDIKLKTCPCCGGEARLNSRNDPGLGIFNYFVTCSKCGLETPRTFRYPEQAIEIWNKRMEICNREDIRVELIRVLRSLCKAYNISYTAYETMKLNINSAFKTEENTKDEKDKSML